MHPGMAATWLLPDVVGPAHARDLLLTGRTVDAEEALRLGLVSGCVEQEGFLDTVLETAAGIAATAPVASRLTTRALRGGGHADLDSALQWEALAQPVTLATDDLQEGSARRASGVPRGSPAVECRVRRWGNRTEQRRGPRCRTPLAFPLRTSSGGPGPRLRRTLGGRRRGGQRGRAVGRPACGQACGQRPAACG